MAAKLSGLADNFGGATLNTAVWNQSSASPNVQVDTALDRVAISCTTNYYALGSQLWDATSTATATSGVYARVVPAPPGNGSTETFFEVVLDVNNKASLFVSGGVFQARVTNAGVNTAVTIAANWAAYDPYNYAWWRITEASGSFVFATSPDGYTWTTRATITYTWNATSIKFQLVTGYFGTESAGMQAFIDHVNTTNSAPGQPNLNWPQIEESWAPFWNANGGTMPIDRYVDVTNRTRQTASVQRGRQYELDQVRSGEATATLANTDGALDPLNASGPWYGHIQPYQPYKRRAQWPPSRNLLTQVTATGGDLGGVATGTIPQGAAGIDVFSLTDSSGGTITASATAWQGGSVFQFAVPNATVTQQAIGYTLQVAVEPGTAYTMQLRVRNVTAATSLQVDGYITFANVAGTTTSVRSSAVTLTGSVTAAWTLITVSGTAPADAARVSFGVETAATAAAACSVQVDGWQWERGATATTWQAPGVWYPMYAGWTERWTPSWDMAGTYGLVAPTAVDTFSLLSQQLLSDPLTEEISSHNPRFLYKFDDPSGSTSATDWTGNYPAAQLGVSKYGAGSWTFGNAITSTDAGAIYTGSTGTVARLNNPNPGQPTLSAATFLQLSSAGIKGPKDPTLWVRMMAFRYTGPTPANGVWMWTSMDGQRSGGSQSGSRIAIGLGTDGKPFVQVIGPTGAGVQYAPGGSANCVDGDWHLLIFGYNQANGQIMFSQDGNSAAFYSGVSSTVTPTGIISDAIGAYVDVTAGNGTTDNFAGDISFACEFGAWFDSTAITNLYQAWKSAAAGESTNARYARILRYAGYAGVTSIQTGLTTSMGPAAIDGQDAMTALQGVVDTENGAHYVDRAGIVTFKARSARYNATVPMYVFGENTSAGEYPYEDVQMDFDSTHLSNTVTVTQESTSQNFYATDATSISNYFPRTLTRTINSSSAPECQDAAGYLLSRYKAAAMRISSIKLHPSANPSLWPILLNLELGTRVRVMRRPPGLAPMQVDCFVENIQVDTDDGGEAFWTLQCSPVDLTPYAVFAAWHTTLNATIAAGVTSITVNASADNTNPLAAQLGPGQSLVLGQNTANQETVTVSAVSATSPGWTTAVITLTAATTKAHTAGDLVNEPLPAGATDPTTYDAVSKFDSVTFAY